VCTIAAKRQSSGGPAAKGFNSNINISIFYGSYLQGQGPRKPHSYDFKRQNYQKSHFSTHYILDTGYKRFFPTFFLKQNQSARISNSRSGDSRGAGQETTTDGGLNQSCKRIVAATQKLAPHKHSGHSTMSMLVTDVIPDCIFIWHAVNLHVLVCLEETANESTTPSTHLVIAAKRACFDFLRAFLTLVQYPHHDVPTTKMSFSYHQQKRPRAEQRREKGGK